MLQQEYIKLTKSRLSRSAIPAPQESCFISASIFKGQWEATGVLEMVNGQICVFERTLKLQCIGRIEEGKRLQEDQLEVYCQNPGDSLWQLVLSGDAKRSMGP